MSGKYQPYSLYKPTDDAMIGEIPVDWNTMKVRYLLKDGSEGIKIGPFGSALKLEDMAEEGFRVYGQENVIKKDFSLGKRKITGKKFEEMDVYRVTAADILITMMGTSGKCEIVPVEADEGIIDSHLLRVRVKSNLILPRFFRLLVDECYEIENQIKISGKGSIMHGLNSSIVKSLLLPLPNVKEQGRILEFLDHETAKIDSLIEKQQQLIKLLKDKRQAVISHAVTKGLNPNAPMRDSGVEWLGEVPEHWEVKRFKFLCGRIIAGPFGSSITKDMYVNSGYKVYGQEQVIPNDFDIGDYYISEKDYLDLSRYKVLAGDILISCVGTFGKIAVFPDEAEPGIINPRLIKAELYRSNNPNYIREMLKSEMVFKQFELLSRGGTMGVINIAILNEILCAVPPYSEQCLITEYINGQKKKYGLLLNKADRAIALLQERRTALISAAVTGKIDVRNWQPPVDSSANHTNEPLQEATHE